MSKPVVVVDVGCRWGFAEPFTRELEHFQLYGFDPDPEECTKLNARYASPKILAVPVALGAETGQQTLYLTKDPACSSLYQPDPYYTSSYVAFDCEKEIGTTQVEVVRLDEWARDNQVDQIDFLKIDTQGSELDVLKGCGDLLPGMRAIEVEVEFNPMYLEQPIFSEVDLYLRSQGFVLWKLSQVTHYSQNQQAAPPIGLMDVRHDDWNSTTMGVFAGQLFWANAHYVHASTLASDITAEQRQRDEILFTTLGMPDVLGDQQQWSPMVVERMADRVADAEQWVRTRDQAVKASEELEARLAQSQAELEQTQAKLGQSQAELGQSQAELEQSQLSLEQTQAAVEQMQARLVQADATNQSLNQHLHDVYQSTSWRMTAPLRWLGNLIKPR